MKKIPYGKQHISELDIQAVVSVLQNDFLTQGPKVKEFEEKFASYVGSKYAIAVSNGTAALHLSALALGVQKGSRVITSPITFAASANCVRFCGGIIEFADIDPNTLCLDINKVREKLEAAPKGTYQGIIPVDFAGYAINMEAFRELANEYGMWILEDSCHAPGGFFNSQNGDKQNCGNGKFADAAIFSFHPVKHIACGEGGMITTNDPAIYKKLLSLRSHGITKDPNELTKIDGGWYYEMHHLGYNYRMPDLLCALGISQLDYAEENLKKRKEIAGRYIQAFANLPITIPKSTFDLGHAFHLFVIQVNDRKALYDYLNTNGISPQIHYIPVHKQPYYESLYGEQSFQHAETYYESCLSIPMYPSLSVEDQEYVIAIINQFYKQSHE
ncbi:UDP-4-amino-4,6-dideoxy-N-acetyl-beta-L-altrosamine transaminase [Candidatus Arcticimaribacter forsetii]|uniref:UDP-4-amino-4, 6-dideoxy-N-acetyl-beta-L-altrosamine transaminase n=1 Tax=Candidatus Arcticimaribacter forsetii TaxID=2820661 RepID=UPI0020772527|nr:UDP-4-amino-4,6-dideoxy-N-acetyl-beta-L-altrosamine transaminase [Candidatus Arcticimaribacter forsetii]MDB2329273.1 UDP-4-amino-4,6-dideoxy-N-acetyl-beta-L-altrosamine transaminase [Flavobacteriaceae bacterium]MDB4674038.1 UDP-4-amino-4,6-dideoxy-N-acetyl-beta-L-altrosamine transaminase [Flavobacteriaceae bacterium]